MILTTKAKKVTSPARKPSKRNKQLSLEIKTIRFMSETNSHELKSHFISQVYKNLKIHFKRK